MYIKPPLPYKLDALEPYYSKQTLEVHEKLHQGYVDNYNATISKLQVMRQDNDFTGIKSIEKDLAFFGSGAVLHTLFFENLRPPQQENITNELNELFNNEFGGFAKFKKEFSTAATTIEGNGWAILGWHPILKKFLILTAENHQNLTIWDYDPILVIDVWEHSYFLQYLNLKAKYIDSIWNIINWDIVDERLKKIKSMYRL